MRTDSPYLVHERGDYPTLERPTLRRSLLAKVVPIAMGSLVLGTGAALAALEMWLILPYLAVMGFLLFEPAGRRVSATNPAGPESADSRESSLEPRGPVVNAGPDGGIRSLMRLCFGRRPSRRDSFQSPSRNPESGQGGPSGFRAGTGELGPGRARQVRPHRAR